MLTFASQTFANGAWTLTPTEPTTIQLAVVGFAMLATYAAVTGWRPNRGTSVVKARLTMDGKETVEAATIRRAA
jgi:hypothetical protein